MDPMAEDLNTYCDDCGDGKDFLFYGLLERHQVFIHGIEDSLVCTDCNANFKRKMNLILHWRSTVHRTTKLIGCDICDAFTVTNGFDSEEKLVHHTNNVHGQGIMINGKDQEDFFCPLCQKKFSHRKGMIEHLQVLHGEHLYGHMLGEEGSTKEDLMSKLLLKCEDCDKSFRIRSTLNRHRENVHNDFNHWNQNTDTASPPHMEFSTQTSQSAIHPNIMASQGVVNTGVTCQYCPKSFSRPSVLRVHVEMLHSQQIAQQNQQEEVNDQDYEEIELVEEDEDEDEDGQEEVIEIAPDFYQTSDEEEDNHSIGMNTNQAEKLSDIHQTERTLPPGVTLTRTSNVSHVSGRSPQKQSNSSLFQQQQLRRLQMSSAKEKAENNDNFRVAGDDSYNEDDNNYMPRSANIIVKRGASTDDDEDWGQGRSKVKKVSMDPQSANLRTSSRIRTLKNKTHENQTVQDNPEKESESSNSEETKEEEEEEEADNDSAKSEHSIGDEELPAKKKEPVETNEECIYQDICNRKFNSYFSMMRHVAFTHKREKTMSLMKLQPIDPKPLKIQN